jgi:hypothetical protein
MLGRTVYQSYHGCKRAIILIILCLGIYTDGTIQLCLNSGTPIIRRTEMRGSASMVFSSIWTLPTSITSLPMTQTDSSMLFSQLSIRPSIGKTNASRPRG